MRLFETIAVAFSMFSAVPMPQFEWNKENMRYALCAFPLIGVLIGVLCAAADHFFRVWGIHDVVRGAVLCIIPLLITGGIHMDGACDTWDALASHASIEKKLEIMKDPHTGSFAMIHLGMYLLAQFALWCALPESDSWAILLLFVMSRILSGLAVASFPMAKNTGLAHTFAASADKKKVRVILIIMDLVFAALLIVLSRYGIILLFSAHAVFAYYYGMSKKQFGGITGDLAGWFLQNCELWMILLLYVCELLRITI